MLVSSLVLLMVVFAKWAEPYIAQYRDVDQDTYEPRENQRSPEYYRDGRYVPWAIYLSLYLYLSIYRSIVLYIYHSSVLSFYLINISLCESSGTECRRCCDPAEEAPQYASPYPQYKIVPQINITILKGTKYVKIYFKCFLALDSWGELLPFQVIPF